MAARSRHCAGCGSALPRSARFCPGCGDPVAQRRPGRERLAARADPVGPASARRVARTLGVAAMLVAGTTVVVTGIDPRAEQADDRADDTVEVARVGPSDADTGPDDLADRGPDSAQERALRPPSCLTSDRATCADPLLDGTDLTGAVPIVFGAVVVDRSLTLRRLQMVAGRSQVRWTTEASVPDTDLDRDPDIDPAPAAGEPSPMRLERTGTTLLLGTPGHLHALDSVNGRQRWVTDLRGRGDDASPWRGWVVDGAVMAVNSAAIVALDAEDGSLLWHRDGPFQDVQPLASGVAVIRDGRLEVLGPRDEQPRWSRTVAAATRFPAGERPPNHGPVVLTGRDPAVLDAVTGESLVAFEAPAGLTQTTGGQVVASVWGDTGSMLVGLGTDGVERWRVMGPNRTCCRQELRPTADGDVIALFPARSGAASTASAWIVDAMTGTVRQRVTRPDDVGWVPRAVVGSTVIWMDGDAFVAADAAGSPRWRAESQTQLLSTAPLLLSTRHGLIRPPVDDADRPPDADRRGGDRRNRETTS